MTTSRSFLYVALAGMALTLSCGGDDTPSRPTTTTPAPTPTPVPPLSIVDGVTGARLRNTLLHELGHTLGLGHSGSGFDVMDPGGSRHPGGKRSNFSDNETAVIRMMYVHRKAGNRPPDADPELFASSFQARTRIIID